MNISRYLCAWTFLVISTLLPIATLQADSTAQYVAKLTAPPGFKIELFADDLPNARSMTLGDKGTLFVGTRSEGNVYAVRDGRKYLIARDLDMPNGIAFYRGSLFVAEKSRILRFDDIEGALDSPPRPHVVRDDLPTKSHHGWRYIGFGPDGRLYISIGAPCNVCLTRGFAEIRSMLPNGDDEQVIARGIRNTVGFTWHPGSGHLWFSNNGRDWLGDDLPPDEINEVTGQGQHFGFPYCHGGVVQDPDYGRYPCADFVPPVIALGAHVAPLGIAFYTGDQFPAEYKNRLFVAEHGSWNRSRKSGYRVAMAIFRDGQPVKYETFVSGWLEGQTAWGRPAYVLVMKDGSLLISDDKRGAIYRVTYTGSIE